jgi:hypothetical protein
MRTGRRVLGDEHLVWVHRNRRSGRLELPDRIGSSMQSWLRSGTLARGWRRRVTALLAEHAGPGLLDAANPVSLRGGVLTLEVADPAALYYLRVRWERPLMDIFTEKLPAAGVHTVRFRLSRGGTGRR